MNEYKAPKAEKTYADSTLKKNFKKVYALVAVKNGEGIIKDVKIDTVSIKNYVKKAVIQLRIQLFF